MSEKLSPKELSQLDNPQELFNPLDETSIKLNEIFNNLKGRRLEVLLAESRMKFHDTHEPGQEIEMSRGRRYQVQKNGSYKRLRTV